MSKIWNATLLNRQNGTVVSKNGFKYLKTKMLWYLEDGMPPARKMLYPVHPDFPVNKEGYRKTWANTPLREWASDEFLKPNSIYRRMLYWGLKTHLLFWGAVECSLILAFVFELCAANLLKLNRTHSEHTQSKFH